MNEPNFDEVEQLALDEVARSFRARGWSERFTFEWLLRNWKELAVSGDQYDGTVDDYTNDLTARDGLDSFLAECREPLRQKLEGYVDDADKEFISRTEPDEGGRLAHYAAINEKSGWWWKRRPAAGPLAEYLAEPIA